MARKATTKGGNSEYHKSTESAKNTKNENFPCHARDAKDRRLFSGFQLVRSSFRSGEGEGVLGEVKVA